MFVQKRSPKKIKRNQHRELGRKIAGIPTCCIKKIAKLRYLIRIEGERKNLGDLGAWQALMHPQHNGCKAKDGNMSCSSLEQPRGCNRKGTSDRVPSTSPPDKKTGRRANMPAESGVHLIQDATVIADGAGRERTSRSSELARDRRWGTGLR
jgi:hypothetical protein